MKKKALILTDLQNDFMPGGALGIAGGDRIIPVINRLIPCFEHVIATLDWHPPHHISFASVKGKWPDHCIQNSWGASLVATLHQERIEAIFRKGVDQEVDSYSVFFDDRRRRSTGLADYLRAHNLQDLYFCGLATDYCVLYSVLDALDLGFSAFVIRDACCAIEDEQGALEKMKQKGAKIISSSEIK